MIKKRKIFSSTFAEGIVKNSSPLGHFKNISKINTSWQDVFLPNFTPSDFNQTISSWRLLFIASVVLVFFFCLFLRLFHLQVINGEENRDLADSNRVQQRVIHAPRGVIFDRNGQVLAENYPGFRINSEQFCNGKKYCYILRDKALELEAKNDPNYHLLEIDAIRHYPHGPITSHSIGYIGQISEEELQKDEFKMYKLGDMIGRSGIEYSFESVLKGKDGAEIIEVDASGKKLHTLHKVDPIPGKNLHLSLDIELQKKTHEALQQFSQKAKTCCGAAVAQNPTTGEILALVSFPSFDNNDFTDPLKSDKDVEQYFDNNDAPLLNRAISGTYPPGSTFKITTALAGLTSGKINSTTQIQDTGVITLGPYQFSNWLFTSLGRTDGMVNVTKALQRSNDIYFYKLGEMVGEETLAQTAKKLGFGQTLGIDLPSEETGLVPTDSWKRDNFDQGWYPGDTYHFAIGQGFLLTTPLQIMSQTSFIASKGKLPKPYLVTKITTSAGETVKQFDNQFISENIFNQEYLKIVSDGLSLVTRPGGTAGVFFNFPIITAGKTGTAEFGNEKKSHAWYTGYGPLDNPTITATALVEGGGEGSTYAAPVVKAMFEEYFNIKVATTAAQVKPEEYINE